MEFLKRYKDVFLYILFGGLTTLLNIISYYLLYDISGMENVSATATAWGISVVFAFITNKLFVFGSKSFAFGRFLKECLSFFLCRIITGALDIGIMYLTVDVLKLNPLLWKILSNIIVIILNYIVSKLIIFKK